MKGFLRGAFFSGVFVVAMLTAYTEHRVLSVVNEVEMALKQRKAAPARAANVVPLRTPHRDPVELLRTLAPGEVAVAFGLPGSGKTTVVEKAVSKGMRHFERIVPYDPFAQRDRANWARGERSRKPWMPTAPVVPIDVLLRQLATGQLSPILSPRCKLVVLGTGGTFDPLSNGRDFSTLVSLLEKVHEKTGLRTVLIGEEFGRYGRLAAEAVHLVASGGAHLGLAFVGITQRWGRIQKDAREAVTIAVAGAIGGDEDYAATAAEFGRDFADRVRALTPPVDGRATSAPIATRRGDKEQSC